MNKDEKELAAWLIEKAIIAKAEAQAHMYILQDSENRKKIPARKRKEAEKVFFANYREAEGRIEAIKALCPLVASVVENYGYKETLARFWVDITCDIVSPAYSYYYE